MTNLESVWQPWMLGARNLVDEHRLELNAMNLFPVPDSDTGSNLLITLTAAAQADPQRGIDDAFRAARGNSGMLLAVWLKSFCASLGSDGKLTPEALHVALWTAAGAARESVSSPAEGTILSVMESLARADIAGDLECHITYLAETAAIAAFESSLILEAAHKAGIADAGAVGFFLVINALAEVVSGEGLPREKYRDLFKKPMGETAPVDQGIELVCEISLGAEDMAQLRDTLESVGQSVVIARVDSENWSIHVHGDSPQALIQAIESFASAQHVRISSLADGSPLDL